MTQWTEGEKGLSGAAEVCVMMRAFERQVTESEQRGLEGGRQGRTAHDTQRGTTYKTTESEDGRCVGWARALGAEITLGLNISSGVLALSRLHVRGENPLPTWTWQCNGPENGADGDDDARTERTLGGK
jgi:hypothetical protein